MRIRGERWRVTAAAPHDACVVLECSGAEPSNAAEIGRFILPFETVDRLAVSQRPRLVRPAVWRRAVAAALADAAPEWRSLRSAARARIALLPYQLEPALAMTRGLACRMLLADEVGLGKTIQAGLLVAELVTRERDARVLIVTPSGLRDQWRDELRDRFSIEPAILDAATLARTTSNLPPGMNPWSTQPVAIASIDFIKRADVIRSLEPLVWDLVAFDEAHALVGRSDRATAAELIAQRARRVILITATPHNGDDAAFERLRGLGRLVPDEALLTFRRSRVSAGLPRARVERRLEVAPTPDEARMHRALSAYAARVAREAASGAARLAVLVLQRRAASSAVSLARSVERRVAFLSGTTAAVAQLPLPLDEGCLDEDEEPGEELAAPGLADAAAERRWLERILALARAACVESKIRALRRLLRRASEPALVFTEYRDTLARVASALDLDCALIHGGLTAAERGREIKRFTHGTAQVLLATDAASEGVNLHHRCRLVINFDVPWTPLRLEQRVGRVDRLGQTRIVHAVTFVARGTSDTGVVSALGARAATAARHAPFEPSDTAVSRVDASAEADRLATSRRIMPAGRSRADLAGRPVATTLRRGVSGSALVAVRLLFVDGAGAIVWDTLSGLRLAAGPGGTTRAWLEAVDGRWLALTAAAAQAQDARLAAVRAEIRAETAPLLARERAMLERLVRDEARLAAMLLQPGLFDRRALREREAQRRVAAEAAALSLGRIAELERRQALHAGARVLSFAAAWLW